MLQYKNGLDSLVEWLMEYGKIPMVSAETRRAIKKVKTLARRKVELDTPVANLRYMETVATALEVLYGPVDGFPKMFTPPEDWSVEDQSKVLQATEVLRFEDIQKLGYKPLFDMYEAARFGKDFDIKFKSVNPYLGLQKAVKLFAVAVNEGGMHNIQGSIIDLYIRVRDLSGCQPTFLVGRKSYAMDLYRTDEEAYETLPIYLRRLNQVMDCLDKVIAEHHLDAVEFEHLPRENIRTDILEERIEKIISALKAVYLLVQYIRIRQMV